MRNIVISVALCQALFSNSSIVEAEKIMDNYQYTSSFNVCVLEKVKEYQDRGKEEPYVSLYDEASSECSFERAKKIYKKYKM